MTTSARTSNGQIMDKLNSFVAELDKAKIAISEIDTDLRGNGGAGLKEQVRTLARYTEQIKKDLAFIKWTIAIGVIGILMDKITALF